MTFKKIIGFIHLWFGLISGIIVLILSITGCILVFELEIKSLISPWLHAGQKDHQDYVPPSALYKTAEKAMPGKEIISVWYHGHGKTAHVSMKSDTTLYVNPYNAELVAMIDHEDFFHFIKDGHYYLWFPPEIGHHVTGWGTLLFFVLTVTGLILWWPKKWNRTERNKSFKIKWKARLKRLNYDLHNVLGFYSLILAFIMAFTALMMSFAWWRNGVYWMSSGGEPRPPYVRAHSDTTLISTQHFLTKSDIAFKKGMGELAAYNKDQIIVSFPRQPSDAIYVCTDMIAGDWRDVYLDQSTFEVLPGTNQARSELNAAEWISRSNYGLHVGEIGGIATKILYFLASLVCASLPVTGFIVWWQKGKKFTA